MLLEEKKKAHPQPSDLFRAGLDTPLRLQGHVQVSHVQKSTSTPIQLFLSCTMYVLSHFSHIQLFATLWTVALQAPLSMRFSRQEYWNGLPFPSPGDLPDPGIKPRSPTLEADALTSEPPGKTLLSKLVYVCMCQVTSVISDSS